MPTIKDVSNLANVSVATVSRVINDNGYVNEKTKERVLDAIKQLDYRPNELARSLFKGRSKMIALFVPDISNPFFPEVARIVEDICNAHGFTLILCNTDNDHKKEISYLHALLQKSIDGIIMVSSTMSSEELKNIKIPIVALDRELDEKIPSITVNNREGARQAVRHIKDLGCKQIVHISGPQDAVSAKDRLAGYLDVVREERWFSENFIQPGKYTYEGAYEAAKEILTAHSDIDGIFAANDLMGVGVLKAAESMGLNVPNDLYVIGFDGIKLGETTSPSLTTMEQPIQVIGKRASEVLIQKIENPDKTFESEVYEVQLVRRESTKERIGE